MKEYTAYFDDAGHPDDEDFVIAAGFIASETLLFEKEWQLIVDRHEITDRKGRARFHRTDFEASRKWTRPEKDTILMQLCCLIRARTQFYISKIVDMAAYRAVNDVYAFEQNVGTPFALVGRSAATALNKWKRSYPDRDKLLVVFEDGTKHKGDFMDAMQRDGLRCPSFASPVDAIPLQAADLLAWDALYAIKHKRTKQGLDMILAALPGDEGIFARKQLEEMCVTSDPPMQKYSENPEGVEVAYHTLPKKVRKRRIF